MLIVTVNIEMCAKEVGSSNDCSSSGQEMMEKDLSWTPAEICCCWTEIALQEGDLKSSQTEYVQVSAVLQYAHIYEHQLVTF